MISGGGSSEKLENKDFMQKSLLEIKEEADKVVSDRKNGILQLEWISKEYTIKIEIKKKDQLNDLGISADQISEEESEVVKRLAEGQKQVQVAKDLGISQAKVSVIKNRYSTLLSALMASAIPLVGTTMSILGNAKKVKK